MKKIKGILARKLTVKYLSGEKQIKPMTVILHPEIVNCRETDKALSCSNARLGNINLRIRNMELSGFQQESDGIIYLDCNLIMTQLNDKEWKLSSNEN